MIRIYTDGGCSGNPGPGGWAYLIIKDGTVLIEESGGEDETTNNRMELLAVISALETVKTLPESGGQLTLYTDSQYVQKGISEWIQTWKRNSWRTSGKKPVKNRDLWEKLDLLSAELKIFWAWVKGHAGNEYNERCDALVKNAIAPRLKNGYN